jgi:hypothetical protein
VSNLKGKGFNKNILIALITTAVLLVLILCTNSVVLASLGNNSNVNQPGNTNVSYQFGYGEPTPTIPPDSTDIHGAATTDGRFIKDVDAFSDDNGASIHILSGTIGLDENLQPLTYLTIKNVTPAPDPPDGYLVVGNGYDFGPSGSTFDPPITLDFTITEDMMPYSANLSSLKLAFYVIDPDSGIGHWTVLGNLRVVGNKLYGDTDHFTIFAILAPIPVTLTTTTQAPITTVPFPTTTAAPSPEQTNWGLIVGSIAGGVAIVALLAIYLLWWRKRSA